MVLARIRTKLRRRRTDKLGHKAGRDGQERAELVIITGMSGSGKASALKAFEDLGFYCVDNLPVELIPRFAELAMQSAEIRRTALVGRFGVASGVRVLNGRRTLVTAHDKLATSMSLFAAGVPHPRTVHLAPWLPSPDRDTRRGCPIWI